MTSTPRITSRDTTSEDLAAPDGAHGLVAELGTAGALPAELGAAFLAAAREWFVPARFWYQDTEGDEIAVDRGAGPDQWLSIVHSDRPLVTQFDDGRTVWPEVGYRPTSSASMPSVVAGMLRALEPGPGDSVLEIGTGTGWNAALLAEIVGCAGRVTTMEIDHGVAGQAGANLRAAGYHRVEAIEGDASAEPAGRQRFDREWTITPEAQSVTLGPGLGANTTSVPPDIVLPCRVD